MKFEINPYTPKTREEFEAYCRAVDDANEAMIRSAVREADKFSLAATETVSKDHQTE